MSQSLPESMSAINFQTLIADSSGFDPLATIFWSKLPRKGLETCLWRNFFCQNGVLLVFWERSEKQFGQHNEKNFENPHQKPPTPNPPPRKCRSAPDS